MRPAVLSLLALALSACGGVVPSPLVGSAVPAATLLAAPDTVTVAGEVLRLEVSAWTSGSQGLNANPFIVSVRVVSGGGSVPAGALPSRLFILQGERVWEGRFTAERPPAPPGQVERIARTSTRLPEGARLNFAVDLDTPQGVERLRLKGDYTVRSPN